MNNFGKNFASIYFWWIREYEKSIGDLQNSAKINKTKFNLFKVLL